MYVHCCVILIVHINCSEATNLFLSKKNIREEFIWQGLKLADTNVNKAFLHICG